MKHALLPALLFLAGCLPTTDAGEQANVAATGGSPPKGEQVIRAAGCGACHTIPGVRGAAGKVGPPLTAFARRTYIAGRLPNTPDNLRRWVLDPQSVDSRTAMPKLGLSEQEARDVAAYLYTLD